MWVPPRVSRELHEEGLRHNAELSLQAVLADELKEWTSELQKIDPYLEMFWAPEKVTHPALKPGRFHVLRHSPVGGPVTVIPLEGPNGEYRELGSWVFDQIRSEDLWNAEVGRDRARRRKQLLQAEENRKRREREERIEEIDGRLKAANNPGVLFSDLDWRYRAAAPRKAV